MELLLRAYTAMPSALKRSLTTGYIACRKWREARLASRLERSRTFPGARTKVCYLTGFPRSGTTMLKYYFGHHPGLIQHSFTTSGFNIAWEKADELAKDGEILIDKSNHYIYSLDNIFRAYGAAAKVCVIVRDPRDSLVSFSGYSENREVPRNRRYWDYWTRLHGDLIRFAADSGFGKNLFVLRYEELVRYPEHAKSAFLGWLGMPVPVEELSREYQNQNPGEGWHDSVHDRKTVSDYSIQKWTRTQELPVGREKVLGAWREHREAREMMRRFGYDETGFTTPTIDDESFVFFREPGVKSAIAKERAMACEM